MKTAKNQKEPQQLSHQRTSGQQLYAQSGVREQTEEALQESERRFRAVWETASDAIALSTPDGIVFDANPAYYRLFGYAPEEILGKNYSIIFPEEQRASAQELYTYIFQSPTISPSFEAEIQRADGTQRIVESSYNFITHNGRRTAMISIVRDVTERKKAEEALRESELKLHLALKLGRMGTWNWDIVANKVNWSANLAMIFGFTAGSFEMTYEDILELVHPEDRDQFNREVKQALEEGTDYKVEFRALLPDGTVRWTTTYGQVLYDEAGKPTRMIGVNTDGRKRKE